MRVEPFPEEFTPLPSQPQAEAQATPHETGKRTRSSPQLGMADPSVVAAEFKQLTIYETSQSLQPSSLRPEIVPRKSGEEVDRPVKRQNSFNTTMSPLSMRSALKHEINAGSSRLHHELSSRQDRRFSDGLDLCTFCNDVRNKDTLMVNIATLEHMMHRFECYMRSLQDEVWQGVASQRVSGIWVVLSALNEISCEYQEADDFQQSLIAMLDEDVRHTIQDSFVELTTGVMNHAPWTKKGKDFETALVRYLASCRTETYELPAPSKEAAPATLSEAVSILERWNAARSKATNLLPSVSGEWTAELVESLQKEVETHLLKHSHFDWWQGGSLPRAFSIGMKDLWNQRDFRSFRYILMMAENVGEAAENDSWPFDWVRNTMLLGGPHIVKFQGDSDTLALFFHRLCLVRSSVLPRFTQGLLLYKNRLAVRLARVQQFRMSMLAVLVAFLTTVFSVIGQFLVPHLAGTPESPAQTQKYIAV